MARDFNQAGYIIIDDDASLDLPTTSDEVTMMAWIDPDDAGDGVNGRIIDKNGGGGGNNGWSFQLSGTSSTIQIYVNGGSGGNARISDTAAVSFGVWQHVAVWHGPDGHQFYVDGVAAGNSATAMNSPVANNSEVLIGARQNKQREFDGRMAHVQIFSAKLTAAEINSLMWHPGSVSQGLVGWWPILGTSTEPDWSTNGNNSSSISGTTVANGPPCGPWIGFDANMAYIAGAAPAPTRRIFVVA